MLDLEQGPLSLLCLPPYPHSGPLPPWATLKITETITRLQPNRPDQISNMNQTDAGISWKSLISLPGCSQMDFGNHRCSYFFNKRTTFEKHRKLEMFISHKDFRCFEVLGFASDLFSPFYFSKKTSKIHTCENTCI